MQEDKGNYKVERRHESECLKFYERSYITKISDIKAKCKNKVAKRGKNAKYHSKRVFIVWIVKKETTNIILAYVIESTFKSIKYLISQHYKRAQSYGGVIKNISKKGY